MDWWKCHRPSTSAVTKGSGREESVLETDKTREELDMDKGGKKTF